VKVGIITNTNSSIGEPLVHFSTEFIGISEGGMNQVEMANRNGVQAFPGGAEVGTHESAAALEGRHDGLFEFPKRDCRRDGEA
jgi:hypothetical protein